MSILLGIAGGGVTLATAAGLMAHGMFHPRSALLGPVQWRGRALPKADLTPAPLSRIALTFDDGPHPQATPRVLDLLDQVNAKACFFVIGQHAKQHPQLLREIHQRGHLIGNHTHDHHHWGTLRGTRYWQEQLARTSDVIAQAVGYEPCFFRPPMGFRSPLTMRAAERLNMTTVTWSRSARDGVKATAAQICARLTHGLGVGDILMMHDGVDPWLERPWEPLVEALPEALAQITQQKFAMVRLDEMLELDGGDGARTMLQ